jgi:hypothetical protein
MPEAFTSAHCCKRIEEARVIAEMLNSEESRQAMLEIAETMTRSPGPTTQTRDRPHDVHV